MKHLFVTIIFSSLVLAVPQLSAHSGGTNKYGCHAGSRPHHCHTPKAQSRNIKALSRKTEGSITSSGKHIPLVSYQPKKTCRKS